MSIDSMRGRIVDSIVSPQSVIAFWREAGPEKWFTKDAAFDADIRARFLMTYERGVRGELDDWQHNPDGALALTILLDQFPRNMFRNDSRAFAADAFARKVATGALARGYDRQVDAALRHFFYMPFMHSEDLSDQERCVALFQQSDNVESLRYAEIHADIIRQFGRFPHRNEVLGRLSTPEELAFLAAGGFAG